MDVINIVKLALVASILISTVFAERPLVSVIYLYDFPKSVNRLGCYLESVIGHTELHVKVVVESEANKAHLDKFIADEPRFNGAHDRISVESIKLEEAFSGTPFLEFYRQKGFERSLWPKQQVANALRISVIYKNGGIYSDLDMPFVNPLLPGMITEQRIIGGDIAFGETINNSFFKFPKNDSLLLGLMEKFVKDFNPKVWGKNGPTLFKNYFPKHRDMNIEYMPGSLTGPIDPRLPPSRTITDALEDAMAAHYFVSTVKTFSRSQLEETSIPLILNRACPNFKSRVIDELSNEAKLLK